MRYCPHGNATQRETPDRGGAPRHRPPHVLSRFERLKPGEAVVSVITFGELMYGVEKSKHRTQAMRQLEELAELIPVIPLPPQAARLVTSLVHDVFLNGYVSAMRPTLLVSVAALLLGSLSCALIVRRRAQTREVPAVAVAGGIG